jgi:ribonuclease D
VARDEDLDAAVRALRREAILGFDTESRPAFRKGESYPPAVVQLAGAKAVYVFQLADLTRKRKLFSLLSSGKLLKVGVALGYDIRKLQEIQDFTPRGFTDLETLTDARGIRNNGLRSLAAAVLGVRISKGAQRSNWGRTPLTPKQITYAATDAWVSREIYLALQEARRGKPRPMGVDSAESG